MLEQLTMHGRSHVKQTTQIFKRTLKVKKKNSIDMQK
jgi:hypothetical protein